MGRIVPIIMGSEKDMNFSKKIGDALTSVWGMEKKYRVASAHKYPSYVLQVMSEYEADAGLEVVYITVAGRSNGLSGVVAANTAKPVIACPPYSDRFGGVDVFSSLRMPSDSPVMTVLEPENAALAAVKIFALGDDVLRQKVESYYSGVKRDIEIADKKAKTPE